MEQDIKAIELIVKLVAKTGLYFSCVDGVYDDTERKFIENYIGQLSRVGDASEVKQMIEHALDQHFTHDEIVANTRELLSRFPSPNDRHAIVMALFQFVDSVIKADGVEHPAETEALIKWAEALRE